MPQVKIGPSYFQQAFKDYSNWRWAWVREIMQNCMDAPNSSQIDVKSTTIETDEYLITIFNNGDPMTEDTLVNKFLALGESGKRFEGTTGGFGKAKELIAFCHKSWAIRTGTLFCQGEGGDYQIIDDLANLQGTLTTVHMTENVNLETRLKEWAKLANWHGTLTYNGEVLQTKLESGTLRKAYDWGKVYTQTGLKYQLIVRVNGTPMFSQWINYSDGCIIIELTDSRVLQSNRDNLTWEAQKELNKFIDDISMNKAAAFNETRDASIVFFKGYKLSGRFNEPNPRSTGSLREDINATTDNAETFLKSIIPEPRIMDLAGVFESHCRPQFFIRIEKQIRVPKAYHPDSFSKNSLTLINNWVNLLIEISTLVKCDTSFSVGFLFSEEARAMHTYDLNYGEIMYINPVKIADLTNYWTKENYWELVSCAAHEIVHLLGFSRHDEKYASKLTEVMAICLANKSKLMPKKLQEFK